MTILIAEDDPVAARLIDATLAKRRFRTLIASTGKEALDLLTAHREDVRLVITDLRMPEMDGLTLVRRMRATREWAQTPVIVCTALGDLGSVDQAADLGCTQYILKPITPALLMHHVRGALGIRRKARPGVIYARARAA